MAYNPEPPWSPFDGVAWTDGTLDDRTEIVQDNNAAAQAEWDAAHGGAFAPTDVGWAHLWLASDLETADGGAVATWAPAAGAASLVHASADPIFEATGINSLPTVLFGVDGEQNLSATGLTASGAFSVVAVAATGYNAAERFYTLATVDPAAYTGYLFATDDSGGGQPGWVLADEDFDVVATATADNDAHLHTHVWDGASTIIEIDGTSAATGTINTPTFDAISIRGDDLVTAAGSSVALFGIFDGDVRTDPAWADFEAWVETTYGITIA